MKRSLRWTFLASAVVALAMFVAACGSSNKSSTGTTGSSSQTPVKGKQGGTLTYLAAADVDYVDPGQDYYTFGYMVQYAVNRTL